MSIFGTRRSSLVLCGLFGDGSFLLVKLFSCCPLIICFLLAHIPAFSFAFIIFLVKFLCKYFDNEIETGQSFDDDAEETKFYSFESLEYDNTDVPLARTPLTNSEENMNDAERILDELLLRQAERNRQFEVGFHLEDRRSVVYLGSARREFASAFFILLFFLIGILIFSFFCGYLLHLYCHESVTGGIGQLAFATVFALKSVNVQMKPF